jgi:putative transposase
VIHRFIAAERANHSVTTLCRVLEVSASGYYAAQRRPACGRDVTDARLGELIEEIHDQSRKTYGAPRVQIQLARRGERVGRKRVARLMAGLGISGLVPKRHGKTTIRVPGITTSPDLVRREWNPSEPNRLWVADITYVRTWESWLYLAAVTDCYSRKVVGWSIADHLRAELGLNPSRKLSTEAGQVHTACSAALGRGASAPPAAARPSSSCPRATPRTPSRASATRSRGRVTGG